MEAAIDPLEEIYTLKLKALRLNLAAICELQNRAITEANESHNTMNSANKIAELAKAAESLARVYEALS